MMPDGLRRVVAGVLFILVLVQGVQAAETYGYGTQRGPDESGDGQFEGPGDVKFMDNAKLYGKLF